jgi:hypothetical protein
MKKIFFLVLSVISFNIMTYAQVRVSGESGTISPVSNSPAFIDATSITTQDKQVLSSLVGKGLLFPRVDLSVASAFPSIQTGKQTAFPTRYDGMIVYNTGTGTISSNIGHLPSGITEVTPGFWYYDNSSVTVPPNPAGNASGTNTGGTWKPLGGGAGAGSGASDVIWLPAFNIPWTLGEANKTVNLFDVYTRNFSTTTQPLISNNPALITETALTSVLGVASDYDYVVTDYDTSSITITSIDGDGTMHYDCSATSPTANSYVNIFLKKK